MTFVEAIRALKENDVLWCRPAGLKGSGIGYFLKYGHLHAPGMMGGQLAHLLATDILDDWEVGAADDFLAEGRGEE